jgi:hypothetical protein
VGADFLQDRVCRSCKDDYVVRAVFSTFLAGTVRNRGSSGRESGPPIRPMSVETRITFFFSLNVKVVGVMKETREHQSNTAFFPVLSTRLQHKRRHSLIRSPCHT